MDSLPRSATLGAMRILSVFLFSVFLNPFSQADQERREVTLPTGEKVRFLAHLHSQDSDDSPPPLLLFLHGGGESGDDIEKVVTHGPPKEVEDGRTFPFIVISPLNPDGKGFWDEDRLARFLDHIEDELHFDSNRVYLVGMSRGGYGAYRLAMENPDCFAAMIVLCAAAPAPYAGWLPKIPIWLIHGDKDPVIPVTESIRMEKAILDTGGNVTLTRRPNAGHDVWSDTFASDDFVEWLMQHQRTP